MRTAVAALDHLVLATPDLAATAAWVAEQTGVSASAGGQHLGRGTHNMLCSLGSSSYLEIIGPDPQQPAPAGARPFGLDELIEPAIVSWAIAVPDIDAAISAAASVGVDPGAAAAMQRRRPDGVLLAWRLTDVLSPTIPFLIDWGSSPHPAADAAPGLEIVELLARHPEPGELAVTLEALGVLMGIVPGQEALVVTLRGPLGSIEFPSS
jgi:hypothetical protein